MPFEVKAVYSVRELARAAGLEARAVKRVLAQYDVPIRTVGPRSAIVCLADLRERFPAFWESILDKTSVEGGN